MVVFLRWTDYNPGCSRKDAIMSLDRRTVLKFLIGSSALSGMPMISRNAVSQQPYPNRPIRVIVPFPAGGPIDGVPRVVAQHLSDRLKWTTVFENRPGANGQLGALAVKQAAPDGYTIGVVSSLTHGSAPAIKRDIPYDARKDFSPIVLLAEGPMVLLVRDEVPARSLREFLDLLKDRPGTLNFSSAGLLSQNYLAAAMLFQRAGLPGNIALHVPYPGIAPAVTALLSGTVQFMITSTGPAVQHIEAGRLRAIAMTGSQRSTRFPNVPTIAESGYPNFKVTSWVGLAAPAETPEDIIARWNAETNALLQNPEIRDQIVKSDYEVRGGSSVFLSGLIAADIAQYRKLAEDMKLTLD
jgi:tripartite-type tricarboxylate transporter receptor subunit TctC